MGSLNQNVRKGGDVMKFIFLICFVINQVLSAPASIPGVEDLTDSDEDGYIKKMQDDHSDEYYTANLKKTSDININRDDRLDDVYGQLEDYYDHFQSALGNPYHQSAIDDENYHYHYLSTATNRNDQSSDDMTDRYYQYLLATMENYHQSADDDRPRDVKDRYHYYMSALGNKYHQSANEDEPDHGGNQYLSASNLNQQSANDVEDHYHQYLSNNINRHNKYDDIGGQFHQFLSGADNRYHQSADEENHHNQFISAQSNRYHQSGKNKKRNDVKNPYHQYMRPVGNKDEADEEKNHYYPNHQSVYEKNPYQYLSSATNKYHQSANDLDHHYHESDDNLPDDVEDQYHQNQFNPFSLPMSKEDSQVPKHSETDIPHYPEQNSYQNYQQWMNMLSNEINSVAIDPYPHSSESTLHNQYPAYQPHTDEYRNRKMKHIHKHRQEEQNVNSWKNDYQHTRKKSNYPQNNNQLRNKW